MTYQYTPPQPGAKVTAKAQADVMKLQAQTAAATETAQTNADIAARERLAKIAADTEKVKAAAAKKRLAADLADESRQRRQANRAKRQEQLARRRRDVVAYAAANAAGVASAAVYVIALGAATYGQISSAKTMDLPWGVGLAAAVFIEGAAIASALTAHRLRAENRRATAAQALTWAFTALAVGIQYLGHVDAVKPETEVMGVLFAAASLAAVVMFELRSSARTKLAGVHGRPPVQWGMKRWIVAPISTFGGWRVDVLRRTSPDGQAALDEDARRRAQRRADRGHSRRTRRRLEAAAAEAYAAVSTAVSTGHLASVRIAVVPDADTRPVSATDLPDTTVADTFEVDTTVADTNEVDTTDVDGPDTGPDALYVPADWTPGLDADTRRLVEAFFADLDGQQRTLVLDGVDTTADTNGVDTTADTNGVDTTADTNGVDTTADTNGVDTPKVSATRTRTPRQAKRTADTNEVDTLPVSTDVADAIAQAAKQLVDSGQRVSARALEAVTPYSKTTCGKWLRANKDRI